MFRTIPRSLLTLGLGTFIAQAELSPSIPGTVISYSPASSNKFVGSPGLVKLPDGTLIASHDEFGGGSSQSTSGVTRIFRSTDSGATWSQIAVINGAFWSSLFLQGSTLHLLGTTHEYGNAVIRRSTDGGVTWSSPTTSATGLLASDGQYHCAPVPVIEANGRLWRAFERRVPASGWAPNFRATVLSAPVGANLLDASQWTFSNFLQGQSSWLDAKFGGWLEGNVVATPNGEIVDLLRVDQPGFPEKAAMTRLSANGQTLGFDPVNDFINLPGGCKKFAIRFDPVSNRYWSLANFVPPTLQTGQHPGTLRNTLDLISSANLRDWTDHGTILQHPDVTKHGFQYVEWQFDGNDLIATCRTSFDDTNGGASDYHNANHLTFHRLKDFRSFSGGLLPGPWKQSCFGTSDIAPDADPDLDGFSNRHEFLAGSNPRRAGSTPAKSRSTARIALAGASGIDEYRVSAGGTWTFLRQITSVSYQSILHSQGYLYGSAFSHIDRIDPATGAITVIATRNSGSALTAGWTNADSQQLALGPDGRLYFSTAFGTSVGQGVYRLNLDGTSFQRFVARTGGISPTTWDLNNARGLAWNGNRLYVSSRAGTTSTSRPIYEFNPAGEITRVFRSDLRAPQGLMSDGGNLMVSSYPGTLSGFDSTSSSLTTLVSGNPTMIAMASTEILGEIHVVTYQHGIWRQRDSSSLTQAFVPVNSLNTSLAVIPETDPFPAWIATFPSLVQSGQTAPGDDPDHDGVPNQLEFLLGWNPTDTTSRFTVRSVGIQGAGGLQLKWPSAPGLVFTVRSSEDLTDWSTIEAVVSGETGSSEATFQTPPVTAGKRFYKVEWTH